MKRKLIACDWRDVDKTKVESDVKYEYYSRSSILAVPSRHHFELFSRSCNPTQCLEYLDGENDVTSPQFKAHLKSVIREFSSKTYYENPQNTIILANLLIRVKDVEAIKLFVNYLLGNIIFHTWVSDEQPVDVIINLLKSVSWQYIREGVLHHIKNSIGIELYQLWIEISSTTGFTEITHKVIERSLLILVHLFNRESRDHKLRQLWKTIFEEMQKHEDLRESWLEKILGCEEILAQYQLIPKLISIASIKNKSKIPFLVNRFIDLTKSIDDFNRDEYKEYPTAIFEVSQYLLNHYTEYEKEFNHIFDCLFSGNALPISS